MAVNLAALLTKSAKAWRDRPAVALGTDTVASYGVLGERVARLAAGMRDGLGLAPGDRVAIAMTNCPEFIEVLFGAWHAGLVAVPMNAKLHAKEFEYILDDSGSSACLVTEDLETAIAEAAAGLPGLRHVVRIGGRDYEGLLKHPPAPLADAAPDDLAWLFYTSGTTGRPKGAMLSHRNLMAMTQNYFANVDSIAATDSIIHAAPKSHGSGLYIPPHVAAGACHVVPESGGFEPDEILALLPHWPGATLFFAPTMVTRLINASGIADADTANLKTIVYGGGPMYAEDALRAMEALGPKLVQIYGQGESPMTITCLSRAAHGDRNHARYMERLSSVGLPFAGVEVRAVDHDDNDAPDGEIGEVVVRGDTVMAGYWRNPAATAETLRGGWLHTGDMGSFDADGFLSLKDRSKDVIISGGSNIYPREVEEVLLRHDGVLEASVVGRPHVDWGEEVVAFVVPRHGEWVTGAMLNSLCLDHIARFKRPKVYRFVDALPKNNYGKVLKTALRDLLD